MEQPFLNQNPNNVNQINIVTQGNIYIQENQYQNQPNNPSHPGMIPIQENQIPEKPFYASQDSNTPYEKPLNTQDNQLPPPPQAYYPPSQNTIPPQPVYPTTQGVINPIPQIIPQNNYYPQNTGIIIQNQPVYKDEYKNYANIRQINHKGIYQTDENTFYISTGCCFKLFPYIFTCVGLFLMSLPITNIGEGNMYIAAIIGIIFFVAGISLFCVMYNNIYFIMGPNTLTVMKKATCRKKATIYNPGEIQRVEFNYEYSYRGSDEGYMHRYNLIIVPTNGKIEHIFNIGSSSRVFTTEEIDYFLYYINTHIQTKMRV